MFYELNRKPTVIYSKYTADVTPRKILQFTDFNVKAIFRQGRNTVLLILQLYKIPVFRKIPILK